jgi:hypothetical protein
MFSIKINFTNNFTNNFNEKLNIGSNPQLNYPSSSKIIRLYRTNKSTIK